MAEPDQPLPSPSSPIQTTKRPSTSPPRLLRYRRGGRLGPSSSSSAARSSSCCRCWRWLARAPERAHRAARLVDALREVDLEVPRRPSRAGVLPRCWTEPPAGVGTVHRHAGAAAADGAVGAPAHAEGAPARRVHHGAAVRDPADRPRRRHHGRSSRTPVVPQRRPSLVPFYVILALPFTYRSLDAGIRAIDVQDARRRVAQPRCRVGHHAAPRAGAQPARGDHLVGVPHRHGRARRVHDRQRAAQATLPTFMAESPEGERQAGMRPRAARPRRHDRAASRCSPSLTRKRGANSAARPTCLDRIRSFMSGSPYNSDPQDVRTDGRAREPRSRSNPAS